MANTKMTLRFYVADIWMFIVTVILLSSSLLKIKGIQPYFRLTDAVFSSLKALESSYNSICFGYFFSLGAPPLPV